MPQWIVARLSRRLRPLCRSMGRGTAVALACLTPLVAAQGFEIDRWTVDGGGVMRSSGGSYEVSGTIGQPDGGTMAGGPFDLTGGFWFPIEAGDCDEDGLVSLRDTGGFVVCMAGPARPTKASCRCFDVDGSGAVDLADFAAVQSAYTSD